MDEGIKIVECVGGPRDGEPLHVPLGVEERRVMLPPIIGALPEMPITERSGVYRIQGEFAVWQGEVDSRRPPV